MGRYLFSFIEVKPQHADGVLKVAALSLFHIPFVEPQPPVVLSMISRLMLLAGEYIYDKYSEDALPSQTAKVNVEIVEAASDLIALGLRLMYYHCMTDASTDSRCK